jgi:hypothetical protein
MQEGTGTCTARHDTTRHGTARHSTARHTICAHIVVEARCTAVLVTGRLGVGSRVTRVCELYANSLMSGQSRRLSVALPVDLVGAD